MDIRQKLAEMAAPKSKLRDVEDRAETGQRLLKQLIELFPSLSGYDEVLTELMNNELATAREQHKVEKPAGATMTPADLFIYMDQFGGGWTSPEVDNVESDEWKFHLGHDYGISGEGAVAFKFYRDVDDRSALGLVQGLLIPGGQIYIDLVGSDRVSDSSVLAQSLDEFLDMMSGWSND